MAEKKVIGTASVLHADNVQATIDDKGIMRITLDTTKRLRPSRPTQNRDGTFNPSKSMIIGTTGGNKSIVLPDGALAKLSVTAYVPNVKTE